MKNLITGNNGFLASSFAKNLLEEDTCVLSGRTPNPDINFPFLRYENLFATHDFFETIFHLAAHIPDDHLENEVLFDSNVKLTERLSTQLSYKHFVFSSSVSVYGTPDEGTILNEGSTYKNPNEYGISKLWGESLLKNASIIRFSSLYGTGMKENSLIPRYVNQALTQGKISVWGKGQRKQNYLHVEDAISLLHAANKKKYMGVLLGTYHTEYSNLQIAEIIQKYTNACIEYTGTDNSVSMLYNNQKTQDALDWFPKIDVEDGIKKYIEWKEKR